MADRNRVNNSSRRNSDRRTVRNQQRELYVYGNTVRELQVEEIPSIERHGRHQSQINRRRKKDQEYALMMNKGYVIFMAIAAIITFAFVINFISVSSSISQKKSTATDLKNETINLKAENDDYERRIERSVDISELKRVAMEELGMVYPDSEHIVKYNYEESDYVRQYAQVPRE